MFGMDFNLIKLAINEVVSSQLIGLTLSKYNDITKKTFPINPKVSDYSPYHQRILSNFIVFRYKNERYDKTWFHRGQAQ